MPTEDHKNGDSIEPESATETSISPADDSSDATHRHASHEAVAEATAFAFRHYRELLQRLAQ